MNALQPSHRFLLALSAIVIALEITLLLYYRTTIFNWLSHNLWVVVIPFAKGILKKAITLKFISLFKILAVLLFHLSKLLLLKILKTLGIRYGVFFSQRKWYWIRKAKVIFLRQGKLFFRSVRNFWKGYSGRQKLLVLIAFFPLGLLFFFLGLSFDITRKTMVRKTQETAIFKAAATAGKSSLGIREWLQKIDALTIQKIQDLAPKKIKPPPEA